MRNRGEGRKDQRKRGKSEPKSGKIVAISRTVGRSEVKFFAKGGNEERNDNNKEEEEKKKITKARKKKDEGKPRGEGRNREKREAKKV